MNTYLLLKTLHVLTSMVFLGTGFGSAWTKLRADRSGDPRTILWAQREIVRADALFTIPAGVLLPVTGVAMATVGGMPLSLPWLAFGFAGYTVSGLCWLPAAFLQVRMRRLAETALREASPLPAAFHKANLAWALLGVPSFGAAVATVWVMVHKGW